jgi:hypothetical protein
MHVMNAQYCNGIIHANPCLKFLNYSHSAMVFNICSTKIVSSFVQKRKTKKSFICPANKQKAFLCTENFIMLEERSVARLASWGHWPPSRLRVTSHPPSFNGGGRNWFHIIIKNFIMLAQCTKK